MISPDTVVTETMEREFPYIEIIPDGSEKETSENTNWTGDVSVKLLFLYARNHYGQ